jgi:uncharacterized membrane protein
MTDTTTQTTERAKGASGGALSQLPVDRLKGEAQNFGKALGHKGASMASSGIESLTGRLVRYAAGKAVSKVGENLSDATSPLKEGVKQGAKNLADGDSPLAEGAKAIAQGDSPLKAGVKAVAAKVKDAVGLGGGGQKLKVTNIVESIDVPVSRELAYRQWTQFEDFPSFMKKVENVKQEEDEVVNWKAQVFWSHRAWKATIVEQVPDHRIVWKSEGEKGHVDGAVTFHELAPDLTRILLTLEYFPKGLFEHTGNLWRAQGRRARLELKHFRRYVSTGTLLHPEEVPGWMGEIRDEEVTESGEGDSDESSEASDRSSDTTSESSSESSPDESSARGPSQGSPRAKKAAVKKAPPAKKAAPGKKAAPPTKKSASPTKKAPAKKSGEPAAKKS